MDALTAPAALTTFASSPAAGASSSVSDLLRAEEGPAGAGSLEDLHPHPQPGSVAPAFGEVLSGFLHQVDESQHRADSMVESLALGEPVDVHQVMLSLNEASNALHLTLQVRSKVLEAYQELMRLPL
jgi:flagellar hook-basal body complex protein FliE